MSEAEPAPPVEAGSAGSDGRGQRSDLLRAAGGGVSCRPTPRSACCRPCSPRWGWPRRSWCGGWLARDSVQPAVAGFLGVGISALIAWVVGESKGYFLLGIWMSLFWAMVFTCLGADSPAGGRIRLELGQGSRPRLARSRRAVLAFDVGTLTWVLVFGSRFVVQHHLYDADQTGWLGSHASRWAGRWPRSAAWSPIWPSGPPSGRYMPTTRPSIRRPRSTPNRPGLTAAGADRYRVPRRAGCAGLFHLGAATNSNSSPPSSGSSGSGTMTR